MNNDEVLNRLHKLINYIPRQKELSEKTGINQNTLSAKSIRNSQWTDEDIQKLNRAYGIDIYKEISQNTTNNDNCLPLPVRGEVSASLGTGIEVYNENQTGVYNISAKVLKDIGANPKESDIIFCSGDSMEPTIQGGSALIVDKSRTDVIDGKIYCIQFNGALMAKRLQLLPPKKLRVISDNFNKYPAWDIDFSKDIDFDFKVIGEVMRWMTNSR